MNPVIETIRNRRSIRDYEEKNVPEETIRQIIDAARWAPSGANLQPWKFIVITNKDLMKKLSSLLKSYVIPVVKTMGNVGLMKFLPRLEDENSNLFYNAPCLILILGKRSVLTSDWDCAMAAENMMLAADSLKLGTCWIGFAMIGLIQAIAQKDPIIDELGIPKRCKVIAPIILGYPKTKPSTPPKKEPEIIKWVK
ncbi:MAG TPA: nitroreductase family protein [Candidatus Methanoperedenaceae archaeon]|nr:nitroreductase family protein [Candidatus Methanoperedenaceae archaeon]